MTTLTPEQLRELAPLAAVIARTVRETPVRLAGPDPAAELVDMLTVRVAAYVGGILPAATPAVPSADRAALFTEAADAIDAETARLRADGVLEPDQYRPCRDASAQLRRIANGEPAGDLPDPCPTARDSLTALLAHTSSDYLCGRFGARASAEDIADRLLRRHTADVRAGLGSVPTARDEP